LPIYPLNGGKIEWENKNESSYDENFYTYYNHALVDFDYMVEKKLNN
jgi:hypothetical protein